MSIISFRRSACLFLAMVATAACVDKSYDFDQVDHRITLGGDAFVLPLVNTGPLTVMDLVGQRLESYLDLNEDQTYTLSYHSAPIEYSFDELKDYDTSGPFRRYVDFPIDYTFQLFKKPAAVSFDEKGEADLDGLVPSQVVLPNLSKTALLSVPRLPEQLAAVRSITLSDDSRFDVTISLPDCMFTEGTLQPDFNVDLSEFFESLDAEDGVLHFDTPLTGENGFSVTRSYNLHKVVFDPKYFDASTHTLMLHAGVKVNGKCRFTGMKTDREHYEAAPAYTRLLVSVTIRTVNCVAFVGAFDYTVKDINTTVNIKEMMGGFTDMFETSDFSLQMFDPEILLDMQTNIPIPTRANINLAAEKGYLHYAEIRDIQFDFPYAQPGETVHHGVRLAGEPKGDPGFDDVIVDFSKVISRVPDVLLFNASASTLPEEIVEVRFGNTYFINIAPTVRIPFAFGPNTHVALHDTLSVPATLGKILKDNSVVLTGEITNTLPLEVELNLVMFNDLGISVTEPVTQRIAANGSCALDIPLQNMVGDAIVHLSRAVLSFRVLGTDDTRPIRADDYLQATIQARVPGGYHFTF